MQLAHVGKITRLLNWYIPLSNTLAAWNKCISKTNLCTVRNEWNGKPVINTSSERLLADRLALQVALTLEAVCQTAELYLTT
jgi:hypothetical protein